MSEVVEIKVPRNPRAGLIYAAAEEAEQTAVRHLMFIIGAGRHFHVAGFNPAVADNYNFYVVGGSIVDGLIHPDVVRFVAGNRSWLEEKRVVLFGFVAPGESVEPALAPIRALLGNAVAAQVPVCIGVDPADATSVVEAGLHLRRLKEQGGVHLSPPELRVHIEKFLNKRKHCVISTGFGTRVRGTSVSYKYHDGHVYISSEGSGKFANIILNNNVCVSTFGPYDHGSKPAGIQLSGTVTILDPASDAYRRMAEIKQRDYEKQLAYPFILWGLDVQIHKAEFWWPGAMKLGLTPKQTYYFT